jgi:osmotically-inducible protein OsmY
VHVNATSYNQVVLLTGEAPREELRTRVEALTGRIPKVRKVRNELIVAAPSSLVARSGDTWITGRVKTNMLAAKGVDAGRVKVVTEGGTVYLLGLVTRAEGDAATEVARQVSGVQRVVKMFEYID